MKKINNNKLHILIAYFFIYVIWGSTYYAIGIALRDLPPFLLGALRFSIAGILLMVWCVYRGEKVFQKSLIMKSAISGIILLFIDMAVIMLAQRYINSSLVAIIAASTSLWIMVLDVRMWKKNFQKPFTVAGIIIGFLGVLMLYIEQHNNEAVPHTARYGIFILLFGCFSWACGTIYSKYFLSGKESINSFAGSAWQMTFASTMFWLCSITTGETNTIIWEDISTASWLSLIYLVIMGSILAYSSYIWLLKIRPATEVGTHSYVNPAVAVIIGVGIGHEQVTNLQIIGLIIILSSVCLVGLKRNSHTEINN